MDSEWAIEKGELYLLQSRPVTSYVPLFKKMITQPGEQKNLYLDLIGLTQGFTDSFSVLGMDIWSKIFINSLQIPEGMDSIHISVAGRQYFHVGNLIRGLGKLGDLLLNNYDGSVKRTMDTIPLHEYLPKKKPEKVKKSKGKVYKLYLGMIPDVIRAMVSDYKKVLQEYLDTVNELKANFKKTPNQDLSITKITEDFLASFDASIKKAGALVVGMVAESSLKKMFKGKGLDTYIMALGSKVNPTSLMGEHMGRLAGYPEIQATKTPQEFISRLKAGEYSKEFLADYHAYMSNYGSRGYKEVDVATVRDYEDPASFFLRLKDINVENNKTLNTEKRRLEAYHKLLEAAKQGKFEKKFRKQAELYQEMFGYREDKKYNLVLGIDMMRRAALAKGEGFTSQGRLDKKEDIFDLTVAQIQQAEDDASFDLKKQRDENLIPYKMVAHVKQWPLLIDSRGKIFRVTKKNEEGDLIGDPISYGVERGKARVLHSPYEKHLEPGEILVTVATEPSWTPVFGNAKAVVMEIGGVLQHGAIIAREYGIPCVGGLTGATTLIKDGDVIEVDGTNGIVKIIN